MLVYRLSTGVVSGLGRQMSSLTGHVIRDVIQTDASINPGENGNFVFSRSEPNQHSFSVQSERNSVLGVT